MIVNTGTDYRAAINVLSARAGGPGAPRPGMLYYVSARAARAGGSRPAARDALLSRVNTGTDYSTAVDYSKHGHRLECQRNTKILAKDTLAKYRNTC